MSARCLCVCVCVCVDEELPELICDERGGEGLCKHDLWVNHRSKHNSSSRRRLPGLTRRNK
jgi:hypothetical protein